MASTTPSTTTQPTPLNTTLTSDPTSSTSTEPISISPTTNTEQHRTDGRRNSFGEILPSPTESWKPTFNRVQSWNREDRKREIVLQREIAAHEGYGGGFSEKK
ncbi:uncharacterized protein LY89DRAFT_70463 [Mollisia scopiformis]|uniref:Uncharacterized protein n=1 Tax=Mollisia scopiformis TaxID=149040 RepID=A0A194XA55_MOLSC|nr:uncharacterized protein LY89DRAFT_70463 [Mollisia scopiformis]KUJ17050.1 hypothetical protein LY89DRAFT_70463 [Mollisia scopiformis]